MTAEQKTERGAWYAQDEETSLETIRRLQEDPPPTPSVAGWLYPNSTTTVFGEPDAGKSMLLAATTARIVRDGGEVLWVDYEMGEPRVLRRLLLFDLTPQQIAKSVRRIHYPIGPPYDDFTSTWGGIDAAMFDGFTGLLGAYDGSSNSDNDIEKVYAHVLRPLAGTGTSVLSLDHVTKDREGRGRWAIGSQRKIGAPDLAYLFEVVSKFKPGYGGKARMKSSRDRDGVLDTLEFYLNGDMTWRLEDVSLTGSSTMRYTGFMERISIYLEGSQPVSGNRIEQDIKGNATALRGALKTLVDEGYVKAEEGPRNATLYTSLRPYRESTDKATSSTSSVLVSSSSRTKSETTSSTSSTPYVGVDEVASDSASQNGGPPRPPNEDPPEFLFDHDPELYQWGEAPPPDNPEGAA